MLLVGALERKPWGARLGMGAVRAAGRTVFLGRVLTARKFLGKGMWYVELVEDMAPGIVY